MGKNNNSSYIGITKIIKLIAKISTPLTLLGAGLILLILRMPGWSLILGLPITVIGVVFVIYTYDEVVTDTLNRIDNNDNNKSIDKKVDSQ